MSYTLSTRTLLINPRQLDPAALNQAADLIRTGQLVAFPTETVYGLGANALDERAVAGIFQAKGRPATDPVIIHIHSYDQLADVTTRLPRSASALMEAFWPGPLTLVLPRGSRVPPNVSAGMPTVAVRMPAHPVASALIEASGVPIAAPSANLFAHSSPTTAQHVQEDLNGRIALILDGGPTSVGLESTILDLTGDHPRLLRPGGIPLDDIRQIAHDVEVVTRYANPEDGPIAAPGMLLKHYSPRAALRLFDGPDEPLKLVIASEAIKLRDSGHKVGLLVADEDQNVLSRLRVPLVALGSITDLTQVAHNLFAGLRVLDSLGVEVILARSYPAEGIGLAIRDRLLRAAEGRITVVRDPG